MNEQDGFRIEAAVQFGFSEEGEHYVCTEAHLIAFAKACERKGRAEAAMKARNIGGHQRTKSGAQAAFDVANAMDALNAATDVELAPILEAEEARFMTKQGYVRATDDQPGARWIKPESTHV